MKTMYGLTEEQMYDVYDFVKMQDAIDTIKAVMEEQVYYGFPSDVVIENINLEAIARSYIYDIDNNYFGIRDEELEYLEKIIDEEIDKSNWYKNLKKDKCVECECEVYVGSEECVYINGDCYCVDCADELEED